MEGLPDARVQLIIADAAPEGRLVVQDGSSFVAGAGGWT